MASLMVHRRSRKRVKPVKLGVRAASFLARVSTLRLPSSFSGRKWTLKTEDLPLMSGGPRTKSWERE